MPRLSELRIGRIVIVSFAVVLISFLLITLIILVYATMLAVQARGAPDQEQITQFARGVGPWLGPLVGLLLTFIAAAWTARRVPLHKAFHGLLIGIVVAIVTLAIDAIGGLKLSDLIGFVLAIVAGWLGGIVGAGRRQEV
jgi:hypothetical protein